MDGNTESILVIPSIRRAHSQLYRTISMQATNEPRTGSQAGLNISERGTVYAESGKGAVKQLIVMLVPLPLLRATAPTRPRHHDVSSHQR